MPALAWALHLPPPSHPSHHHLPDPRLRIYGVEQRREHWVERHHRFLRVGIGNVPQSLILAFFSGRVQKTWSLHSPLGLQRRH